MKMYLTQNIFCEININIAIFKFCINLLLPFQLFFYYRRYHHRQICYLMYICSFFCVLCTGHLYSSSSVYTQCCACCDFIIIILECYYSIFIVKSTNFYVKSIASNKIIIYNLKKNILSNRIVFSPPIFKLNNGFLLII